MRRRRVKFIWGASRVIRARWHLGLFGYYERAPGDIWSGLAISMRGVLAWGALFAAGFYVAGATALSWVWRRNPYNQLTWTDAVLYPLRREAIAEKKGRAYIAQGTELFRAEKFADAANYLRLGLARHPTDLTARLQLAQFYLMANQRPLAGQVLEEGLRDTYPGRPYLEALFNVREQAEDYAGIVTVARRYGAHVTGDTAQRDRRWLESREFAALVAAGEPAQALALAERLPPGDTADELRVLALLALNRAPDAIASLEQWERRPGADRRLVLRLRGRALREAGRLDDMEAALIDFQALDAAEPSAFVHGIVQRLAAGRDAAAEAAFADYLFRFGGSAENLLLLAEPLAERKNLRLLQRLVAAAAERGYPLLRFQTLLVHAHLAQGEWPAAAALLAKLPPDSGRDAPASRIWREWMQRLVEAADAPADPAQLAVLEFLRSRPWPMRMFRTSIETLLQAGRFQTARDAVAIGLRGFPANAWLRAKAEEVKREFERTPRSADTTAASGRMLVERLFFERLDQLVAARQWQEAEQLIRELRASRPIPTWLDRREPDLWLVQAQYCQARGDMAGAMAAVRMYLPSRPGSATPLLQLARGFHQGGDRETAVAIAKEIVRRYPAEEAAQRQLAEWEPKPLTP